VPKIKFIALVSAVFLALLPSTANAQNLDDCRLPDPKRDPVSLGFPIKAERLKYISNPKILVIPFQSKYDPDLPLSPEDKAAFLQSTKDIQRLSSNKSNVTFVYHPVVKLEMTSTEIDKFKINARVTFQSDFPNDQFGFATNLLKMLDPVIDYTGIDGVVLYGKSKDVKEEIASALQFTRDVDFLGNQVKKLDGSPWYSPIVTNEKEIANVVLMYNRYPDHVITHELLHNYGLVDLYGTNTGPERLSIMASHYVSLMTFEKWWLGWHESSRVSCISGPPTNTIMKFKFDYQTSNQLALIRTSREVLYGIETSDVGAGKFLSFYKLDMGISPPINLYNYYFDNAGNRQPGVGLLTNSAVGQVFIGDTMQMFVFSKTSTEVTFYVYPNALADSPDVRNLKLESQALIEKANSALKAKKSANSKQITITCVKGKVSKKVIAVKPKCPTGYKKK
jgi:hypothetical protein